MLNLTLLRISACISVLILKANLDPYLYICFFYAILFSHYLLQVYYSKKQIKRLVLSTAVYPALLLLFAFYCITTRDPANTYWMFGIHLALTDTYVFPSSTISKASIKWIRMAISTFTFFFILRNLHSFKFLHLNFYTYIAFSTVLFFLLGFFLIENFIQNRKDISNTGDQTKTESSPKNPLPIYQWLDIFLFELVALPVALLSLKYDLTFEDIVYYHLIFWVIYPMMKISNFQRSDRSAWNWKFIVANTLVTFVFFLGTPVTGIFPSLTMEFWRTWSIPIAHFHILSSFALSINNPMWIVNYFYRSDPK